MKIRFAVGPHAGSHRGAEMTAFAEALEAAGFDGRRDGPVSPATRGNLRPPGPQAGGQCLGGG